MTDTLSTLSTDGVTGLWPSGSMRALAITGVREIGSVQIEIPAPAPETALVRPVLVGLCGTDLELFHGTASYLHDGRAQYPLVFGHEWYGVVQAAPFGSGLRPGDRVVGQTMIPCGQCRNCQAGRRTLCDDLAEVGLYGQQGAAARFIRMPVRSLVTVPMSLPDRHAALVEPAVTVVGGLDRAGCRPDDRVAVVGTGTIGLLAVQYAARYAGTVHAIGVDDAGLDLAIHCGADRALRPEQAERGRYSLVVEASGAAAAFRPSLDLLEPGGRAAVIGVAGEPVTGFVPGDLALRGIEVFGIRHGLDYYRRAIDLMVAGVLDPEPLVAGVLPAEAAREAFDTLEGGRSGAPKLLLDFATRPAVPTQGGAR
jgi:threonine dehydrogenase-like Zn-dependent dehydrogenase